MGFLSDAFSATTPTSQKQYTLSNGTASPYDPTSNYDNSGMSQDAYYKMYGTPDQQAGAARSASSTAYSAGNAAANNPSINTTLPQTPPAPQTPSTGLTYGTESGPGLMDQWFNSRATGTDPGYEYATGRGLKALDNEYAARGGYNSGASTQSDSDYLANMGSQREGQLDSLAGAASGERANSLSTMLGFGAGITSGMAGLTSNYDLGAANALNTGNAAALQLGTNAAMAPYQAKQGLMGNLFGAGALGLMA